MSLVKPVSMWSKAQIDRFVREGLRPERSTKVTGKIVHQIDRDLDGNPVAVVVFEHGHMGTEQCYKICVGYAFFEDRVMVEKLASDPPLAEGQCLELAIAAAQKLADDENLLRRLMD